MIIREIGRILVSLLLLVLAGFLFYFGLQSAQAAQALGIGAVGGSIVSAVLMYWLKP